MNTQCPSCLSCGMPLENSKDARRANDGKIYCVFCLKEDGSVKSYEEILDGCANHLAESQGINPRVARSIAEKELKKLPFWKERRK